MWLKIINYHKYKTIIADILLKILNIDSFNSIQQNLTIFFEPLPILEYLFKKYFNFLTMVEKHVLFE